MVASANDAHPYPIYNARYRVIFPILDADGDFVTGATAPDSEVSQDCGTFADATNEITEIASASGMYFLDLIATEMDCKSVAITPKTTSVGAKTTPIVLYPTRLPVIRTGTAQAGAASTITLDTAANTEDDFYVGCFVNITNDTPANARGQARRIIDYVGSTKVATIEGTWGTNPSSSSTFEILLTQEATKLMGWGGSVPLALLSSLVQVSVADIAASKITNATIHADTGLRIIHGGLCEGGASGSITLDAGASSVNDFYKGTRIHLIGNTGIGQSRLCTGYNGSTKVATIEPNWITNPQAFSTSFAIRWNTYTPAIATSGIAATSFVAGAINNDALATDTDGYGAKMWVIKQGTTMDQYGVSFHKNNQPIETGITSPLIDYVKKLSDASILINDAVLIDQSNGDYYYEETTNKLVGGNAYMMRVTATIDGSTRIFKQQLGRDSV